MKYKLSNETKVAYGTTLHRLIFACADEKYGIKAGDLSGWITELSIIRGEAALIFPNAMIFGGVIWGGEIRGGRIFGGIVRGGILVDCEVYGGVIFGGIVRGGTVRGGVIKGGRVEEGEIFGGEIRDGIWTTSPLQIQGSRHFVNMSRPGYLKIGCLEKSIQEWKERYKKLGKLYGYTTKEIREYKLYIDLAARLDLGKKEKEGAAPQEG